MGEHDVQLALFNERMTVETEKVELLRAIVELLTNVEEHFESIRQVVCVMRSELSRVNVEDFQRTIQEFIREAK